MRTTINIDDELLMHARRLTGIESKTELVNKALRELVASEAGKWLAAQGGTDPSAAVPPRRKPWQDAEYERWKKSKRRAG